MARPSQAQDQALLSAAAQLYPELGCAAMSVRRVAEAAGVNPAMVHYHFGSKDAFLRALLQQRYEEMFEALSLLTRPGTGDAMERLAAALFGIARFVREHRPLIARVWADAQAGEAVAQDFLRANAPRHLGVLLGLLREAQAQGGLPRRPPMAHFSFLMGAVVAPLVLISGMQRLHAVPAALTGAVEKEVFSDAALRQRIDWALLALCAGV